MCPSWIWRHGSQHSELDPSIAQGPEIPNKPLYRIMGCVASRTSPLAPAGCRLVVDSSVVDVVDARIEVSAEDSSSTYTAIVNVLSDGLQVTVTQDRLLSVHRLR